MTALERIDDGFAWVLKLADRLLEAVTSGVLVVVVAFNGGEIVYRNIFNSSFDWLYEINILLANWLYFLGICHVYYKAQDITVDWVLGLMGADARRLYLILVNLATIATLGVVVYYAWELIDLQKNYRTMGVGIRNHLFSLPVLIGGVLMAAIAVRQSLALWLDRPVVGA